MKKTVLFLMIFCIFLVFCGCKQTDDVLVPINDGSPSKPPPIITVTIDGKHPDCSGGSFWSWYRLNNGMIAEINDMQVHPLDIEYKPFETSIGRAELQFSEPPTSFSAIAYPNVPEGEPRDDVYAINLEIEEDAFSLLEGDYVYEVYASWEYEGKGASGRRGFNAIYTP